MYCIKTNNGHRSLFLKTYPWGEKSCDTSAQWEDFKPWKWDLSGFGESDIVGSILEDQCFCCGATCSLREQLHMSHAYFWWLLVLFWNERDTIIYKSVSLYFIAPPPCHKTAHTDIINENNVFLFGHGLICQACYCWALCYMLLIYCYKLMMSSVLAKAAWLTNLRGLLLLSSLVLIMCAY